MTCLIARTWRTKPAKNNPVSVRHSLNLCTKCDAIQSLTAVAGKGSKWKFNSGWKRRAQGWRTLKSTTYPWTWNPLKNLPKSIWHNHHCISKQPALLEPESARRRQTCQLEWLCSASLSRLPNLGSNTSIRLPRAFQNMSSVTGCLCPVTWPSKLTVHLTHRNRSQANLRHRPPSPESHTAPADQGDLWLKTRTLASVRVMYVWGRVLLTACLEEQVFHTDN